jgi:hypothetical protein
VRISTSASVFCKNTSLTTFVSEGGSKAENEIASFTHLRAAS